MKQHDLSPPPGAKRPRKRVARGNSGSGGTYAGRGRKGQNARSGGAKGPYFEGGQLPFVRRVPFRRGFKNIFRVEYTAVNLAVLEALFEAGAVVTPEALAERGVLRSAGEPYKVLAHGGLTKALTVHAPRISAGAREAITAVGGSVEALEDAYRRPGLRRRYDR
jgi:large subunit ribosomal protein L15